MTGKRFDDETIALGERALGRLRESSSTLETAILLSDDGFEAVRMPPRADADGRFASMASSVQALGEAVSAELDAGEGEAIILQAARGFTLQMRVQGHQYVVAAHFRSGDSLGTALVLVRTAAQEIADGLTAMPPASEVRHAVPPIIAPPPTSAPVLFDPPTASSAVAGF